MAKNGLATLSVSEIEKYKTDLQTDLDKVQAQV